MYPTNSNNGLEGVSMNGQRANKHADKGADAFVSRLVYMGKTNSGLAGQTSAPNTGIIIEMVCERGGGVKETEEFDR